MSTDVDAQALRDLMAEVTGVPPVTWGRGIVGFGTYHYRYASDREGDWFAVGLAARKSSLTVYLPTGLGPHADLLAGLGPHTTGTGCLYLKRLADVDEKVLRRIVEETFRALDGTTVTAEPD
jgi:hypothetical protein